MTFTQDSMPFIPSSITSSQSETLSDHPFPVAAHWRTSSFSGNNGTCVEVAALSDGHVAIRNSKHPHDGTILLTHAEISAIKAGELDDLGL